MPYSANDLRHLVSQYLETPAGKKLLAKESIPSGRAYSAESMRKIAYRLRDDIIAAYQREVKDASPYAKFDVADTSVYTKGFADGSASITILFRDDALRRPSLYRRNWEPTGSGVYDIFGLLTQGYSASNYTYGIWVHNDGTDITDEGSDGIIRSLKSRQGSDFINKVIEKYRVMFPDITFRWPKLWGGNGNGNEND